LTEGSHCSRCNDATTAQEVVDALGHDMVTDAAVDPTCTATGLTAGSHCSRCDGATTAQEVVAALGHSTEAIGDRAATCTEKAYCSRCESEYGEALGHDEVSHEAKAPTCTEFGWDAYVTCSRCSHTTYEIKDALGHSYGEWVTTKEPTVSQEGEKQKTCSGCGDVVTETILPTGYNDDTDEDFKGGDIIIIG